MNILLLITIALFVVALIASVIGMESTKDLSFKGAAIALILWVIFAVANAVGLNIPLNV